MAEKDLESEVIEIEPGKISDELMEYNPYGVIPTLVDRNLVVYKLEIITEYLDERFPYPPLMPAYPIARAESRLFLYRITQDWFSLADEIVANPQNNVARCDLHDSLIASTEAVSDTPFFASAEFSMLDCYVAPLLWRLPNYGINLEGVSGKLWQQYMKKIFARNSFQKSLTHDELYSRSQILKGFGS